MKIVRAEVSNFKRISVVEITPDGSIIEVSGKNRQGKSSILDAIESALRGKKHHPPEPIRRGQKKARVVLDLGDLIVERVWTEKSDRLVVRSPEGAEYPKAQARLGELVGGLAFDPQAFSALPPKDQREALLEAIGVDLSEYEAKYQEVYEERREVGRELRQAEGALSELDEPDPDTPEEEVSSEDLARDLEAALKARGENAQLKRDLERAQELEVQYAERVKRLKKELKEAEASLELARDELKDLEESVSDIEDPPVDEIRDQISRVNETNSRIRQAKEYKSLAGRRDYLNSQYEDHTLRLQEITEERDKALESADMPIEGLGVTEDGVMYNGLPLEQASQAERVGVCTAVSSALNPKLKIALIRHGNDMDEETLKAFYEACEEQGVQAWVERIDPTLESAVVIEEGKRKED